ncbi:MAG: hypothetical protein JXN59_04085 [Anaerolineae bacterium]|nr:hypothetical protein [Anaerolineae bacterium]
MRLLFAAVVLLLFLPGRAANSQAPASCPQIVQLALDTTDQVCSGVGENQACYGHVQIDATPRVGVEDFRFQSEGDVAKLFDVQTLRLSPMDLGRGTWGVALINMQAYLKYASPENVTFLLFGDVEVEDTQEPLTSVPVVVRANEYVNARIAPHPDAGVVETLTPGQSLTAQGRTADGAWVRVVLPVSRRIGWIDRRFLVADSLLDAVRVVDNESEFYGPMQAFYFRSGTADAYCPESPESGLLVQTPEGVAEVTLLINEVSIEMQATAFLQAQPGGEMTIGVVEGWAEVEANGQRQPVFAGTQVRVSLNNALQAGGGPSAPEPYELARLQALPLGIMAKSVALADPLPEDEIAMRLNSWAPESVQTVQRTGPGIQPTVVGEPIYFTDEGQPVYMSEEGALVVVGDDGVPVPAGDTPGELPTDTPGTLPTEPPDEGEEVVTGPPGLDGVLPPGLGGDNPGTEGGVPPGQAKKDD